MIKYNTVGVEYASFRVMSCQESSNIYIESLIWNVWSKTCQLIFKRIDCVIGKGSPLKKKEDTITTEIIVLISYHIHHTKVWVKNIHFLPLQYHRTLLMHGINRLGWWLQIHTVPSHAAEWDSQQALSCEKTHRNHKKNTHCLNCQIITLINPKISQVLFYQSHLLSLNLA